MNWGLQNMSIWNDGDHMGICELHVGKKWENEWPVVWKLGAAKIGEVFLPSNLQ